jgi:hypothetical protein
MAGVVIWRRQFGRALSQSSTTSRHRVRIARFLSFSGRRAPIASLDRLRTLVWRGSRTGLARGNPPKIGRQICCVLIGLRDKDLLAQTQHLLISLGKTRARAVLTRLLMSSYHRPPVSFHAASTVGVCRGRVAAGSNAKLLFGERGVGSDIDQRFAIVDRFMLAMMRVMAWARGVFGPH